MCCFAALKQTDIHPSAWGCRGIREQLPIAGLNCSVQQNSNSQAVLTRFVVSNRALETASRPEISLLGGLNSANCERNSRAAARWGTSGKVGAAVAATPRETHYGLGAARLKPCPFKTSGCQPSQKRSRRSGAHPHGSWLPRVLHGSTQRAFLSLPSWRRNRPRLLPRSAPRLR